MAENTPPSPQAETAAIDTRNERPGDLALSAAQKRKASSVSDSTEGEGSPKRVRRTGQSPGGRDAEPNFEASKPAQPTVGGGHRDTKPTSRDNTRQEEKRRANRLFGALRSTLSQTTTSSQQQRRQEIERRQQDKLEKQRIEEEEKRRERNARLYRLRMREQIVFEERVMKAKHKSMRALAKCLRTNAEPQIYYLPWKLTKDQEDTIQDQIQDTESAIAKEVEEFGIQREQHIQQFGRPRSPSFSDETTLPGRDQTDGSATAAATAIKASTSAEGSDNSPLIAAAKVATEKEQNDEAGDVVVEADEDTVLY